MGTHQSVPPAIKTGKEPECRFLNTIQGDLRTPPPFLCAWVTAARGVWVGHGLETRRTTLSAYNWRPEGPSPRRQTRTLKPQEQGLTTGLALAGYTPLQ